MNFIKRMEKFEKEIHRSEMWNSEELSRKFLCMTLIRVHLLLLEVDKDQEVFLNQLPVAKVNTPLKC